jgi:NitT/TauT family transport system permease protein
MSLDLRRPTNNPAAAELVSHESHGVARVWSWVWPKALAIFMVLAIWQVAVWVAWRPEYILPSPFTVFERLWDELLGASVTDKTLWDQLALTLQRGLLGYALAILIGTALGIAVVQWRVMRLSIASMIAGLQTMPSIAWFPLAILLFGLTETAIMFVVVLGAAPSIAGGVIAGIDEVPPPLLRAGQMLGARGIDRYRFVVLPAAMPTYLLGLKQGWAFSWRSLLAGELLVPIGGAASLGSALTYARTVPNAAPWLLSLMIVILVIGMVIDAIFGVITRRVRENRGLTGTATT